MANTQDTRCGRMSPVPCPAESPPGVTLEPCLKRSQKPKFQCLLLADGQTPAWCEATALKSLGGCLTPNISESPSGAGESFLSAILEEKAPEKYFLSKKACEGILRRAANRGKELPLVIQQLDGAEFKV